MFERSAFHPPFWKSTVLELRESQSHRLPNGEIICSLSKGIYRRNLHRRLKWRFIFLSRVYAGKEDGWYFSAQSIFSEIVSFYISYEMHVVEEVQVSCDI
ncbi:hypothetical protein CEXT_542351 [Caerostris extrusa]|uniref:Maturase K n=1 Tax=Caerostris extrusa TaxID=172846 RepID=A0AAV4XC20_CAEEX|nr:hypothetical protein CEXT_542351 [Caerostris extrusa]